MAEKNRVLMRTPYLPTRVLLIRLGRFALLLAGMALLVHAFTVYAVFNDADLAVGGLAALLVGGLLALVERRRRNIDLARRQRQQADLLRLSQSLLSSLEPESLIQEALRMIHQATAADLCAIAEPDEHGLLHVVSARMANDGERAHSLARQLLGQVLSNPQYRQTIVTVDWQEIDLEGKDGLWTGMSLPLLAHEAIAGLLLVASHAAFDEELWHLLQVMGAQLTLALQNAELHRALQFYAEDLEKRVSERTHQLEEANKRLGDLDKMKSVFLTNVSHEMRTPLVSIKGFASTLLQEDVHWDMPSVRRFAEIIDFESDRLTMLVDNLLEMSRIEARLNSIRPDWIEIEPLMQGILYRLQGLLKEHQLCLNLPPDLPPLYADGRRLSTVLVNLLDNAVKYSAPGTEIRIAAAHQEGYIRMTVTDHGLGIAPENHERIFERYYRVEREGAQWKSGSGVGLAICQAYIKAHQGRIWVESQLGHGSSFHIELPLHASDIRSPSESNALTKGAADVPASLPSGTATSSLSQ